MEPVNFWVALLGGGLLGFSAWLLLAVNGRIAGISGIVAALLTPVPGEWAWRLLYVLGLAGGAALYGYVVHPSTAIVIDAGWPLVAIGGLIVGLGTRIGGGCTSGHGICGMARLSVRSVAATLIFMAVAVVTVFVTRHLIGG